jgi:uncharacterized membrane protein
MQVITHKKHAVNMCSTERMISLIGGGVLAVVGLERRSSSGLLLALLGGEMLRRGITGHSHFYQAAGVRTAPMGQGSETTSVPYELGLRVDHSVTIAKSREEVFQFWRDIENFPRFMKNVDSVRTLGDNRSHWVVRAPAGRTVEWDAVVYNEEPNSMIAWRTLPDADVDHAGSVWFKDAPMGRGTEVKVELQYNPPAGVVGAVFAMLWGKEPEQQIKQDLARLKQILETGEIQTTDGQTSGRRVAPKRVSRKNTKADDVDQASIESFPASDAPVFSH